VGHPADLHLVVGHTYGRHWNEVVPVALALTVALPIALVARRELDLLALDDDTPRLVGVPLDCAPAASCSSSPRCWAR
jgi:ferric hydroxamate transport system permease protein